MDSEKYILEHFNGILMENFIFYAANVNFNQTLPKRRI